MGDEVMTLRHDRKHKLQCLWAGPYKIVKRLSPVNYILENKPGKHKLLHINQLKAYVRRDTHLSCHVNRDELGESFPCFGVDKEIEGVEVVVEAIDSSVELTLEQRLELRELILEFRHLFTSRPGKTNLVEHTIELTDDSPFKGRAYMSNPRRDHY